MKPGEIALFRRFLNKFAETQFLLDQKDVIEALRDSEAAYGKRGLNAAIANAEPAL